MLFQTLLFNTREILTGYLLQKYCADFVFQTEFSIVKARNKY